MKAHNLAKLFTRQAEHHVNKAKHHETKEHEHRGLAQHFTKLADVAKGAKSEMHDPATFYRAMSAHHEALADSHAEDAEEHVDMGESCAEVAKMFSAGAKAMMGGVGNDLDALMPLEGLSRVTPDFPQNLRAVPRFGARPIPTGNADATIAKIFETGTDE